MRLKLSLLLVLIFAHSWSQTTKTFTVNGTFTVPAGVNLINVQAWGGGGSGGGASGSPLLLGRGAAGGGGGAYASAAVSVTPSTTLNVVVAGQTLGTSGTGTAGGNSTITGFESSILAAGGSGGSANNAGGIPLGGVGGTIAASVGSSKFAGSNGGNGNSWNLLGLLLSSGAGGNGANSGGAGGAAVAGLILSNAPGNAGSAPGGAGSGGINSALGAAQSGGAGAAGRVIISYTCPTFNVSSTAATNVCASAGSTSIITLTSGAGSLPVGNYVVTYNRSNPSATGLTANLTVSTAGTGTFTVSGLTIIGSSIITITKLTSETCSSNITTNNTATVTVSPDSVGGAVTGGTTIISGNRSDFLFLSGHTGAVVKWQSAVSPFTTWTDIGSTANAIAYKSVPLTVTTQFRAVIQSGSCAVAYSDATTVTVEDLPTIQLADFATDVCSSENAQTTQIPYKGTTVSPITYSIVWDPSPANDFVAVIDAALPASPITIDVPAGAAPGTYTGTLTVKNAGGGISTGSNFSVVVNETPTLTTEGVVSTTCATNAAQLTFLEYTESTGNPTSYSIDWDSTANAALLEDEPSTANTFDPNGGSIDIKVPANVVPGTYSGILTVNNGFCTESQPIILKIIPGTVAGAVTGGTTIGSGATSGLLTLSGHDGTVVVWESSVSPFTEWTEIENTAVAYTSGPLTETTQFRALVRKGLCDAFSQPTTVTVEDLPTITLSDTTAEVCVFPGSNGAVFQYSATTGNPITYSVVWNSTPTNNFVPITDAALPGFGIIIPIPEDAEPGTYEGTLTVKNANGLTSDPVAIVVKAGRFPGLTTNGVIATVSASTSAQTTTLEYSDLSGPPISYSIDWNNAANAAFLQDQPSTPFTDTSGGGIISTIEVSANAQPGTYTGRLRLDGIGGCINLSQQVTLKINPAVALPTITLSYLTTQVCFINDSADSAIFLYSATTGNPVTYSVVWSSTPTNNFEPIIDSLLEPEVIDVPLPGDAPSGTYEATVTVKNANGDVSSPVVITVKVGRSAIAEVDIVNPVYSSTEAQTSILPIYSLEGYIQAYSIDWDNTANAALLQDQSITSFFAQSGNNTEINTVEISAFAQPGNYNGIITFINDGGGSCDTSYPIHITINPPQELVENSISVSTFNKVVNVESNNQNIDKVLVYDVSGNLVYKKTSVGNSKLSIDNLKSNNQVLVVKVVLDNQQTHTKKVIY